MDLQAAKTLVEQPELKRFAYGATQSYGHLQHPRFYVTVQPERGGSLLDKNPLSYDFVFHGGKRGEHAINVGASSAERLLAHWDGYVGAPENDALTPKIGQLVTFYSRSGGIRRGQVVKLGPKRATIAYTFGTGRKSEKVLPFHEIGFVGGPMGRAAPQGGGSAKFKSRGTYVVAAMFGGGVEAGRASTLAEAKRIALEHNRNPIRRWRETGYEDRPTEYTSDDSDYLIFLLTDEHPVARLRGKPYTLAGGGGGARSSKPGLGTQPPPGTLVRLTGKYLKSTGQQAGREGASRWKTVACNCGLCQGGRHVAVDEKYDEAYRKSMWGDLPEAERPRYRHIALGNLEIIGAKPKAADYP